MEEIIKYRFVLNMDDVNKADVQVDYKTGNKSDLPLVGQIITITKHEYLSDGVYKVIKRWEDEPGLYIDSALRFTIVVEKVTI